MFTNEDNRNSFFQYLVAIPSSLHGWEYVVARPHDKGWIVKGDYIPFEGTMWEKIERPVIESRPKILAIIGTRTFGDIPALKSAQNYAKAVAEAALFEKKVTGFIEKFGPFHRIISGGARGADTLAKKYAEDHSISFTEFPADWDSYGKGAGFRRNEQMHMHCTHLLAFWDGVSTGTAHMVGICKKSGYLVGTVNYVTGQVEVN